MEAILGRIFLVLVLIAGTFVFYLQINSLGIHIPTSVIARDDKPRDEIACYYFTGVSLHKMTFHNARLKCPTWLDIY